MATWIIAGATSAIAVATARKLALRGDTIGLMARQDTRMDIVRQDLLARGAPRVECAVWDAENALPECPVLPELVARLGRVDGVLVAHGTLTDQARAENEPAYALREITINGVSVVMLSQQAARMMEQRGGGTLVAISSVAGDRGRQSNYTYGASKALVSAFLSGLRNRHAKSNVHVITVKPGFVDTPMTASFEKSGPLWAQPETIAAGILDAIDRKRDVVYLPWFWQWIMLVIRHIPERIFKRLSL